MEKCRCKVTLSSAKQHFYNGQKSNSAELQFTAQYDEKLPEDQRFAKATPSATFTMVVDNPSALEFLQSGKGVFYVDFVKAE